MPVVVGTIVANAKLDITGLTLGIAKAEAEMKTFGARLNASITQHGQQWGRNMMLAGTAITGALGLAVKSAADFDQAMRNINSIAQISEGQFQSLTKQVLSLVNDPGIRQGPTDLAKGLYDVVSSGFSGAKAMEILRVSAKGASAGMTDTATASRVLMAVLNSGIKGVDSVSHAMDILFQEVNLGVNTFEGLANALGDVLPTAKTAGVSLQEVSAALATMTRRGININEAVTALNQLLNHIIKPGKESAKVMEYFGIQNGIAALESKGLTGVLQQMMDKLKGNKQAYVELIPEVRGMKALLTLVDEGGRQNTEMLKGMGQATDGVGQSTKALNEQSKGAAFQFDRMKVEGQALAIEVGNVLLPNMRDMVAKVREGIQWFRGLSDANRDAIVTVGKWVGVSLLAGGAILKLTGLIRGLTLALGVLTKTPWGIGITFAVVGGAAIWEFIRSEAPKHGISTFNRATREWEVNPAPASLSDLTNKLPGGWQPPKSQPLWQGITSDMIRGLPTPLKDTRPNEALASTLSHVAKSKAKIKPPPATSPSSGGTDFKDAMAGAKEAADKAKQLREAQEAATKQSIESTYKLVHTRFENERFDANKTYRDEKAAGVAEVQARAHQSAEYRRIAKEEQEEITRKHQEQADKRLSLLREYSDLAEGIGKAQQDAFSKMEDDRIARLKVRDQASREAIAWGFLRTLYQAGRAFTDIEIAAKKHTQELGASIVAGLEGWSTKIGESIASATAEGLKARSAAIGRAFGEAIKRALSSLSLAKEAMMSAADELYSAFAKQMEKLFGGLGTLGKIISTALTRIFNSLLNILIDKLVTDMTKGKKKIEAAASTDAGGGGAGKTGIGSILGGVLGTTLGGGIGGAIGGALGGLLNFDNPINDRAAVKWGFDFGRHFVAGAAKGGAFSTAGAGAGVGSSVTVNLNGTNIYHPMDVTRVSEQIAYELNRKLAARPGR